MPALSERRCGGARTGPLDAVLVQLLPLPLHLVAAIAPCRSAVPAQNDPRRATINGVKRALAAAAIVAAGVLGYLATAPGPGPRTLRTFDANRTADLEL